MIYENNLRQWMQHIQQTTRWTEKVVTGCYPHLGTRQRELVPYLFCCQSHLTRLLRPFQEFTLNIWINLIEIVPSCYLDTLSVERTEKILLCCFEKNKTQQMKSVLLKWIESWMLGHLEKEAARPTRKGYWQPQCFFC